MSIHIEGLTEAAANKAINTGFAAVAMIHERMSFHQPGSDVSRLNRAAARKSVKVAPETYTVLRRGLEIAAASDGAFDFTIGAQLVAWGYLPRPARARTSIKSSWRDVELLTGRRVRFHRPLWIDLGGIAKGFAVDAAIAAMKLSADVQCCVNAGGDLRVSGPRPERVLLRVPNLKGDLPVLEIEGGSVATSSGHEHRRRYKGKAVGPHVDGSRRQPMGLREFVTVAAETCIIADALTKVVLAKGMKADGILHRFEATAYLYGARSGWRTLGIGAGSGSATGARSEDDC